MQGGYQFKIDTFGSMVDGKMGNNRFDAGIALGLTFEYRRFIIGAETQVGLVKVNEQINQMIGHSEEGGYFPKNFAVISCWYWFLVREHFAIQSCLVYKQILNNIN